VRLPVVSKVEPLCTDARGIITYRRVRLWRNFRFAGEMKDARYCQGGQPRLD